MVSCVAGGQCCQHRSRPAKRLVEVQSRLVATGAGQLGLPWDLIDLEKAEKAPYPLPHGRSPKQPFFPRSKCGGSLAAALAAAPTTLAVANVQVLPSKRMAPTTCTRYAPGPYRRFFMHGFSVTEAHDIY